MNATKCDCCGKIVGNDEAFKIDVTALKTRNSKIERIIKLEICDACKNAVLATLQVKEAEHDS